MRAIISEVPIRYGIVAVVTVEVLGLLPFYRVYVFRFTQSMVYLLFFKMLLKYLVSRYWAPCVVWACALSLY